MTPEESAQVDAYLKREMPDEAAGVCVKALNEDPDDELALFNLARALGECGRHGVSANLYRQLIARNPNDDAYHNNLGHALHALSDLDGAEDAFKRSLQLNSANFHAYNNLVSISAARCKPEETFAWADWARFFADPQDHRVIEKNICLTLLGTRQWHKGWRSYDANTDHKWRFDKRYGEEPHWAGKPNQTVIFHGEQGLGDELLFASMLDDACRDSFAIIDCDPKLEGLFRRSFPRATVYGTRFEKLQIPWLNDHDVEARCALGALGKFYRNHDADFPRRPYLIPCPTRRKMYRGLLDKLPGKKIGIAWSGGTKSTRQKDRSLPSETVANFARFYPAHSFISLEYKGEAAPYPIHHWPWAIRTPDYDDTAALVAELDCVISVTTAVALLAGAIGTECHVMVPLEPTWHWGYEGDMPWLPLNLYRGDLMASLKQIGEKVCGS